MSNRESSDTGGVNNSGEANVGHDMVGGSIYYYVNQFKNIGLIVILLFFAVLVICVAIVLSGFLNSPLLAEIYHDWIRLSTLVPSAASSTSSVLPTTQNQIIAPTVTILSSRAASPALTKNPSSFFFAMSTAKSFSDGTFGNAEIEAVPEPNKPNAHKITFSHSDPKSFCGSFILLGEFDASRMTRLSFWVRGEKGGEKFAIGIKDKKTGSGNEPKIQMTAGTTWKRLSIPLAAFQQQDLTQLENLSISSTYEFGNAIIFVDEFIFE